MTTVFGAPLCGKVVGVGGVLSGAIFDAEILFGSRAEI